MKHKLTRLTSLLLALIMSFSMLLVPANAAFVDVPEKAWYADAVEYVQGKGWMNGVSAESFAPNAEVTRAMFVTVLARFADAENNDLTNDFADVPADTWYTKAVSWAAANGIVNGVSASAFAPNRAISRQDLCTMLYRYLDKSGKKNELKLGEGTSFTDAASISGYANEAVAFCAKAGLVAGYTDETFRPRATASRAMTAAILMRLDKALNGEYEEPVPMPEQYFDGQAGENMSVSVYAPEGALPEDTNMTTSLVTDESALDNIQGQLTEGNVVAAADITFTKDDAEIEPSAEVEVLISVKGYFNANNLRVYHVKADGTIEPVDSEIFNERTGFRGPSEQTLHFFANDFSVYAIVDGPDPGVDDDYPYRTTYEFYNADGTKFYFNDAAGNAQYTQILKDGEELADVGIPSQGASKNAKFVGWYIWNGESATDENGSYGAKVEIGQPLSVTANGTVMLKAKLQGLINVFFVTAVMEDDQGQPMARSIVTVKQVEYTVGQAEPITVDTSNVTTEAPTTEQAVIGWNRDETAANEGTVEGTNGVITLYANGDADPIIDVMLFPAITDACWLYFNENDGGTGGGASYTPPQFVTIGGKPTRPADPHRTGYKFDGWYKDEACTQEFDFNAAMYTTTTVYAKWVGAATTYTIIVWEQRTSDSASLPTNGQNRPEADRTYDFYRAYSINSTTGATATVAQNPYKNLASEMDEYNHIKYNRCDADKIVAADGSTVMNVYYDRDVYTLRFRNSQYGSDQTIWHGLYDATLAEAGYTWTAPGNNQCWRSSDRHYTFIDSFKDFDNSTKTDMTVWPASVSNDNYSWIFQKETLTDGEYQTANTFQRAGGLYLSEKYQGFTLYQYRDGNNDSWHAAHVDDYFADANRNLWIRYSRNSYNIEYHNGARGTEGTVVKTDSVKYEAPLAGHSNPTVTYPVAADADHYEFIGWFADSSWSTMVTFTELTAQQKQNYTDWYGISSFVVIENMPSHNFALYAGYALKGWDCAINPNGGTLTNPNQAGVFWLDYGQQFSSDLKQNITREGYVFQGWMLAEVPIATDAGGEKSLTLLNVTTDANNHRFVGDYSNWTITDTPWQFDTGITGPTAIMAKWFYLETMNVVYDAGENGTNAPVDEGAYSDHATTVAFRASVPNEEYAFVGWDIQGTETVEKLQPGETFEINSDYASEGTVTLVAVYVKLGEDEGDVPVTHIDWYANNKTTGEYQVGKTEDGQPIMETQLTHFMDTGMQINAGIDIRGANTFTNYGYQFLGWAKLHKGEDGKMYDHLGNEVTAGSDHQDYNLTAADLYLKYDPENNKFQVKVGDDWKDTTQVAADEHLPYEDLYAVWDTSYFYVFHSASGKLDAIPLPTEVKNGKAEPGTFDLTTLVPADKLYGGYYKEYGGADKAAVKTAALNYEYAKNRADWNAATVGATSIAQLDVVPNANFKEYTGSTAKNGAAKWWEKAKAYKTGDEDFYPGNALTPKSGEVYYLKEVPNTYLAQKYRYVYDVFEDNKIINLYSITVIDDANYTEVGFREGDDGNYANIAADLTPKDSLCMNFTIVQKGYSGAAPTEYKLTPKDMGVDRGYLAVSNYDDEITTGNVFSLVSAWETLDGITVSNIARSYEMITNSSTNVIDEIKTTIPEGIDLDNHLYVNVSGKEDGGNVWWFGNNIITVAYFFTPKTSGSGNSLDVYKEMSQISGENYLSVEVPEGATKLMILRAVSGSLAADGTFYWDGYGQSNVTDKSGIIDLTGDGRYNQQLDPQINLIDSFTTYQSGQPSDNDGVSWGHYEA